MKKLLVLTLTLCLLAGLLSGCGKKEEGKNESQTSSSPSSHVTVTPSPAPAKTAKAVKVDADDGLNIRSEPSTDGEILGLAEDESMLPLLVEKADDGWYQVEYKGKSAYVSAEYAKPLEITLEEYNKLRSGGTVSSAPSDDTSSAVSKDTDPQRPVSTASPKPVSSEPSSENLNDEDGE